MSDYIIKITAANGTIRGFFATTRELANRSFEIHQTTPVVSAAMGRLLTAAAIMGSMLKNDQDLVTISIRGNGPMKGAVVTADNRARVKGYVYENMVDLPLKNNGKLDVSNAIGEGTISIIRDMGLKEPYIGQIPIVSGEIAEDLTYYFSKSEQIPSSVALGVLVDRDYSIKHAGGFLLQLMPGVETETIDKLEEKLRELPNLTSLYEQGKTNEDIIEMILGDFGYKINETIATEYYCNCSREKVEKIFISLGRDELSKILEEDQKANLHCHFCNKDYFFKKEDIEAILN